MDHIGINIGSSRTVIHGTSNNNHIILDPASGKRYYKSGFELSSPLRHFGNSATIAGPREAQVYFPISLTDINRESLLMFLSYLSRVLGSQRPITLALPFNITEPQRREVVDLSKGAGLNLTTTTYGITCAALNLIIRKRSLTKGRVLLIDCGESQTTVGVYSIEDNILSTERIDSINIGGGTFNDSIVKYLLSTNKVQEELLLLTKYRLYSACESIKSTLNNKSTITKSIEVLGKSIKYTLSREKYLELIQEDLNKIKDFLMQYNKYEVGGIELIGGNQNNNYIMECINSVFKKEDIRFTLEFSESISQGAAFAGVALRKGLSGIKLVDYIPTYTFNIEGVEYTSNSITSSTPFNSISILEDGVEISTVHFSKSITYPITIKYTVDLLKLLTVNTVVDENEEEIPFTHKVFTVENINELIKKENTCRRVELDFEEIGNMRNKLEALLIDLPERMDKNKEFKEEDFLLVQKVTDCFYEWTCDDSHTLIDESTFNEKCIGDLENILSYFREKYEKAKEPVREKLDLLRDFISKNKKYTTYQYKLSATKWKLEQLIKGEYDIYTNNEIVVDIKHIEDEINNNVRLHMKTIIEQEAKKEDSKKNTKEEEVKEDKKEDEVKEEDL